MNITNNYMISNLTSRHEELPKQQLIAVAPQSNVRALVHNHRGAAASTQRPRPGKGVLLLLYSEGAL